MADKPSAAQTQARRLNWTLKVLMGVRGGLKLALRRGLPPRAQAAVQAVVDAVNHAFVEIQHERGGGLRTECAASDKGCEEIIPCSANRPCKWAKLIASQKGS